MFMSSSDAYLEELSSQLPALQLLITLSWSYLSSAQALRCATASRSTSSSPACSTRGWRNTTPSTARVHATPSAPHRRTGVSASDRSTSGRDASAATAPAYYGIVREALTAYGLNDEDSADIDIRQEAVIEQRPRERI